LYASNDWNNAAAGYKNGTLPLYGVNAPEPLMFLPANGYRFHTIGEQYRIGQFGCYWSATKADISTDRIHSFDFSDGYLQFGNGGFPADGKAVRCIKEDIAPMKEIRVEDYDPDSDSTNIWLGF
jgi:hypothetical protein